MSRIVFGVLLGIAVGVGAGFALDAWTRTQRETTYARVPVLVTPKDLPAGHRLSDADLEEAEWPKVLVTESCATPTTRARFVGQTLRWRVSVGAVVRDTDLVEPHPACATRAERALEGLDGGADVAQLVAALRARRGGAR